jgi:hypothetical protein
MKQRGWWNESERHKLAAYGIISKNGSKGVTKNEKFNFLGAQYDVYKAAKILEKNPRKPITVSIKDAMAWVGNEKSIGMIHINKEYAKTLTKEDMRKPAIGVTNTDGGIIIDGWHRIYANYIAGNKTIKVYVLTPEESWTIGNSLARKLITRPKR